MLISASVDKTIRLWSTEDIRFCASNLQPTAETTPSVNSAAAVVVSNMQTAISSLSISAPSTSLQLYANQNVSSSSAVTAASEGHTHWVRSVSVIRLRTPFFFDKRKRENSSSSDLDFSTVDDDRDNAHATVEPNPPDTESDPKEMVISASRDKTICIWDPDSHRLLHKIENIDSDIFLVEPSASGVYIACVVNIIDHKTGELIVYNFQEGRIQLRGDLQNIYFPI